MSSASIDPDTSIARITVPSWLGTATTACGRATATDMMPSAGTKAAVVRVDAELLAGLAVGQDHRTDVRQLSLARVRQSDGHGLVASRDTPQALLPSGGAEEIGDDEHE